MLPIPASPIASNYPLNEQWAPLALYGKKAPLRRKLRGQHKLTRKAKSYENGQSKMRGLCLSPRALANWFYSLTSNTDYCYYRFSVAVFLQLSTTSSEEDRWLNLQIQRWRRNFYTNMATTTGWLSPVLALLRASKH